MALRSRMAEVQLPEDLLLPDYVMQRAESFGDRQAMVDATSGQAYTFRELADNIRSFSSAMLSRGMRGGDVLLVYTPNCIQYPVIFYGVTYIGGVITTANPMYTEREIENQLVDANVKYVCTNKEGLKKINGLSTFKENIRGIFLVDGGEAGYSTVDDLIEEGKRLNAPDEKILTGRSQEDTVAICYSSGTSGLPKGVMISHKVYLYNILQLRNPAVCHLEDGNDVTLAVLPFFHLWGLLTSLAACIERGCTNVVFSRFIPESYIKAIEKYKATILYVVPPILLKIAHSTVTSSTNMDSVKHIISAAAPLGEEIIKELQQVLPPSVDLKQGFGMTEVALTLFGQNNINVPMSSGILLPNVQAKVVDIETRKSLGANERGEVLFKSPTFLNGYLHKPELTRQLFDEDDWLQTGDIGYYDEDENWYIVDRLKEIINYKGYNICPAELEDTLLQHPDVDDVAVVGVPDKEAIELPRAYVVKKEGSSVNENDIIKFMEDKLSKIKRLQGGVRFVETIPKSPSGKILRRLLRDRIRQETNNNVNDL